MDNSDTVRARVACGFFERIADWCACWSNSLAHALASVGHVAAYGVCYCRNGYGRALLPQTAGVAVEATESSPATTAALMSQAAQLGVRPKIFTRPREPFEYADLDRCAAVLCLYSVLLRHT